MMTEISKRINLGCGNRIMDDCINHDVAAHRPEIDIVFDLNVIPYPLEDNQFERVYLWSVIEHLKPTPLETLNEIWRILKPGGILELKFPLPTSPTYHDDLTHRWANTIEAYEVVDPTTKTGKAYGFYTPYKWHIINRKTHKNFSAQLTMKKVIS